MPLGERNVVNLRASGNQIDVQRVCDGQCSNSCFYGRESGDRVKGLSEPHARFPAGSEQGQPDWGPTCALSILCSHKPSFNSSI